MRFWPRSPWLRHALAIGVAVGSMSLVFRYRVLGWSIAAYLPWVGSAVVALNLLLLLDRFIDPIGEGSIAAPARRLDFGARLLIVVFAYWAIFVAFNASLDRSPTALLRAEVVDVGGRTVSFGVPVVYSWATLRISDEGRQYVRRITLGPADQRKFWRGEALLLAVRGGRFGVPWLFAVDRDETVYCRRALELAPNAVGPWHDLVRFLFEHGLIGPAIAESRRYLDAHPKDHGFAYWAGENMIQRGFDEDGLPFLARAVALRPIRYYLYRLGWTLTRKGDVVRALETLTEASRRYPDDWEFPFLIAYNHAKAGRYAEATTALRRIDALKPGMADVTTALARLSTPDGKPEADAGSR